MELIDEDGRIVGLVNVIDALVVLLVLAVVVAGVALVDPFDTETRSEETRIEIVVTSEGVLPQYAEWFEAGMTYQEGGESVARIVETRVEPSSMVVANDDGEVFERDHPRKKDLTLVVDVQVRESGDGYRFQSAPIRVGEPIELDFGTIAVNATVTDIRQMDD